MIVQKFLEWSRTASAANRADGVSALARAYLYTAFAPEEKAAAETALTMQLDDPPPLVRRALAESFASASEAPRHIVLALASDQSDIATLVLARSPLLGDGDLIDCAAIGDAFAQAAIALRSRLSAGVASALAEVGAREALISLVVNHGAELTERAMRRIVQRYGDDGEIREALLSRPHLPASLRSELVLATSRALSAFVTGRDWLSPERAERVMREAREKAQVIIATSAEEEGEAPFARYLRQSGQLTAGLVLRALLSGNTSLFEGALCELSGLPMLRVAGLARDWRGAGFAALYARAGLSATLLPAFRAALGAMQELGAAQDAGASARLSRKMIERVLTSCARIKGGELDKVMALLRRFESEAAREDAREHLRVRPLPVLRIEPRMPLLQVDFVALEAELAIAA